MGNAGAAGGGAGAPATAVAVPAGTGADIGAADAVAGPAVPGPRRIAVLPPEEARKIAAGEVVDRPAALVRELLDNAIDSGGTRIEVSVDGGGCRRVEVSDDGEGMDRENLELCTLTHATSKIRSLDDLARAETLGFRGEALAAAAAVAALEITSSVDGREAWKLLAGPGESRPPRLEPANRNRGASVRALGLFDTIPARKRFLKREGSEAMLCRQAFIDKALAFPQLDLRFIQDGALKLALPKVESPRERFAAIVLGASALSSRGERNFLHELYALGEGFRVTIVVGGPELYRNDRRQQFIFANRRRIQDFSLLQALEYGVQGWFPNGTHPVGAVYIDIDPALADFNIHPAKREVRFADSGAIHHAVTGALRGFLRSAPAGAGDSEPPFLFSGDFSPAPPPGRDATRFPGRGGGNREGDFRGNGQGDFRGGAADGPARHRAADYSAQVLAMEALLEHPPAFAPLPGRGREGSPGPGAAREGAGPAEGARYRAAEAEPPYGGEQAGERGEFRFIGRVFGLFLLAEQGDRLFIIDQHAAHERILYDRFLSAPIVKQELLVPIGLESESPQEDAFLRAKREEFKGLGIVIEEEGAGRWQITALPEGWRLSDGETREALRDLRKAGENLAERWAATLSCHRAVRDGDYLDVQSARTLAEAALALPVPRCPHGRPVWIELSREQLYRGVKRT
jgi:DNA mismatch repair protein MutL